MSYKIGEVARLAKVSIKTLHHYDAIGLLVPTGRTESGYRLYSMHDLLRLQQILIYRELEFSLEQIHHLMANPAFDYLQALKQQKHQLEEKQNKLTNVIGLIDRMITNNEEDSAMSLKEMFEVFPEIDKAMLDEEERRWGHTEEHHESMRRAKNYTRDDWEALKAETEALYREAADLFRAEVKANAPRAMDLAERLRLCIDKWSYPCSREFHVTLTEMTSADERYREHIDEDCPGLAAYIHAAAKANLASP